MPVVYNFNYIAVKAKKSNRSKWYIILLFHFRIFRRSIILALIFQISRSSKSEGSVCRYIIGRNESRTRVTFFPGTTHWQYLAADIIWVADASFGKRGTLSNLDVGQWFLYNRGSPSAGKWRAPQWKCAQGWKGATLATRFYEIWRKKLSRTCLPVEPLKNSRTFTYRRMPFYSLAYTWKERPFLKIVLAHKSYNLETI